MHPELHVTPIRNGTVLDHVPQGRALIVLRVLGLPRVGWESTVSAVMNVPSGNADGGRKDIVKVEDRELTAEEEDILAVVAPGVTVNVIRGYGVAEKRRLKRPTEVSSPFRCMAQDCITRTDGSPARFQVDGAKLQCSYCGTSNDPVGMLAAI